MRALLRRLGVKTLAGLVVSCALWSPLVASPALAASSQTCIYEGGSPTTPATNVPSYIECDSSRNTFTNIAAPLDGSGNVKVDVAAGSVTVTFPYAGTNGQTLTAASFVGVGALDANGKFSPLQEDASQNLLAKIVSGSTTAVTQATAANLNATVIGSGNFTVVQPTGTNLHAVLDTTSTTAVTQATASNLNAAVVGVGAAGTPSGGVLSVQGVASGTALPVSGTFFQATQPVSCATAATCPVNASQVGGPWTQNLTQVGGSAVALGQTTMSASLPVAIASNQSAITVAQATAANLLGTMTEGPASSTSGNTWNQTLCNYGSSPGSTACANVENNFPGADANGTSVSVATYGYPLAFNGSTWDRERTAGIGNNVAATGILASAHYGQFNTTPPALSTGNYGSLQLDASSILLTTSGGAKTTAIAAATSGPTVIKGSAGRLVRVLITTAGTSGTETFYDNASACSGTIIGIAQGTTAVPGNVAGTILFLENPAANGVTACGGTGSAAITVSYY